MELLVDGAFPHGLGQLADLLAQPRDGCGHAAIAVGSSVEVVHELLERADVHGGTLGADRDGPAGRHDPRGYRMNTCTVNTRRSPLQVPYTAPAPIDVNDASRMLRRCPGEFMYAS